MHQGKRSLGVILAGVASLLSAAKSMVETLCQGKLCTTMMAVWAVKHDGDGLGGRGAASSTH